MIYMGHSTPNGAKHLRLGHRLGHDRYQNLIKTCQVVAISNPESFSLISCTD